MADLRVPKCTHAVRQWYMTPEMLWTEQCLSCKADVDWLPTEEWCWALYGLVDGRPDLQRSKANVRPDLRPEEETPRHNASEAYRAWLRSFLGEEGRP